MELKNYRSCLDRGASRLTEVAWIVARFFFFSMPYPLPSRVRCFVLRCFGARIGVGVVIRSEVSITFPWRLTIGDHVWIGEKAFILNLEEIVIESDCCISQGAFLCTGSHRFSSPKFDLITRPITVRKGSWIAARVFVAPGVSIGPNSMCVAGSVVLNDVAAETTVIGNPATTRS
ncbi:colanic acid biosynthesis acetyltransferase WcaF [Rhodopirellula bahusiensis]|uniref:Colanic acid biosynthesis acetyltransferase WcaF n=1 Tax=Rhodopirellula bahusiensis TaxID=2014065 RepID=A0A2G1WCV4_9BACT|nr:colanic acid biosynthesis acetyltransferase WcaF [Rhodopirellula bahusiensis]